MVADIIAVFTLTISSIGFPISLAVLIFSGALEAGMSRAIGSFVVGSGVLAILVARRSRIVPVAMFVQDGPAILMAALAADFMANERAAVADVFVLLVITMLATATVTGVVGHFGLGGLARYVPTSVVGAFLGGTGWLLFKGGIDVMIDSSVGLDDLGSLFGSDIAKFWVPGLTIGLVGWLAGRSPRVPPCALGLIILSCLAGFYAIVAFTSSVSAVESAGWLLGPFPETDGIRLVTPAEFRSADWVSIARTAPAIAGVVGLTCVAQLLNLTGIRSELFPELDVDHELRTSARASLAVALLGVSPGFPGLGYTMLLNRLGATRRAVSVVSGCLVAMFGVVGVAAVGYVPRLIVGALLVMIGVALVDDWVHGVRRSASVVERILGLMVVGAIAWFGLLQGIAVGLAAACAVFIVRYSRVDPVRSAADGRQVRSQVDRSPLEAAQLKAAGGRLLIFELQGFLFFGSLTTLEDRIRRLASGQDTAYLVLDFANVTGVDRSAYAVISRLAHELRPEDHGVWISGLDPALRETLLACEPSLASEVVFFHSLDLALEGAEEGLLASMTVDVRHQILRHDQTRLSPQLISECAAHRFQPGTVIVAQGAPGNGVLIVQRGRLAEFRVEPGGRRTRLRRFGEFTAVGEVGLLADTPHTTEVLTEGVVDGWWLSLDRYHELRNTKPWLIFELHEFIVRVQAERLKALSESRAHHMRQPPSARVGATNEACSLAAFTTQPRS